MVFEKVRELIAEQLELEEASIKPESNILEDLGADSLDVVDLVMSIEDEFNLEVPDEEIEHIKTVGDVVKFIEENQ
jgi:acyl carrier protein